MARNLDADDDDHTRPIGRRLKSFFGNLYDDATGALVSEVLPLGHGAVLSYPDRPYLKWSYTNGMGERVERDNPREFEEAARALYQSFCRYREYPGLGDRVFGKSYTRPARIRPRRRAAAPDPGPDTPT